VSVATEPSITGDQVAVLVSGGLDSAVLTVDLTQQGWTTHPIYVRFGLAWEQAEEAHLRRFLETVTDTAVSPLVVLHSPIAEVYGSHWSASGRDVPDDRSADDAVYLPGRNLLLLAQPAVWCALHDVHAVALGTLKGNPFPDGTPEFFGGFASLAQRALGHELDVLTPFAGFTKADVLELGRGLALEHTFSCIHPQDERHCGHCNKCAERRRAFATLQIEDVTDYVQP
jgi:7-cyano-7-deazaguanine synthase